MPVIQLPTDTRFGDLGKALGGVVGQFASALAQNKLDQGVAEVEQDPSIADDKKGAEIFKRFGEQGTIAHGKLLEDKHKNEQIKHLLAQTGTETLRQKIMNEQLPTVGPQAAANVAHTLAGTAGTEQATLRSQALLPGDVTQQAATTASTIAGTSEKESVTDRTRLMTPAEVISAAARAKLVGAEAGKADVESQLLKQQLDRNTQLLSQGPTGTDTLDKMLDEAGIKDPAKRAAAKMEYGANLYAKDPAKAGEAFAKSISQTVNAESVARIRAQAPSEAGTKEAANAAEHAASMSRFLKSFTGGGAQQVGMLKGAPLKAFLESKGFPTGDPELIEMMNANLQQVASSAMGGGGFGGEWKTRLASKTTPSITETPLHAIIAADQVADRMIERLDARLQDHPEQKSLQTARDKWGDVKKVTGSYQSYDWAPDPKQPTKLYPVVLFNGDQVDAKTFKPIVEGKRDYSLGKSVTVLGTDVIADARRRGMSPMARLEELKAKYGGGLKGSQ